MKNKVQIFDATVLTCATYALEVLGNDLSGLSGGGCGGGCSCSGSNFSLTTIKDLIEILMDTNKYDVEYINHDQDPNAYYEKLHQVFTTMDVSAAVNAKTVEYIKSMYHPIIAVDGKILSMGRIPEDYELFDALESQIPLPVDAPSSF